MPKHCGSHDTSVHHARVHRHYVAASAGGHVLCGLDRPLWGLSALTAGRILALKGKPRLLHLKNLIVANDAHVLCHTNHGCKAERVVQAIDFLKCCRPADPAPSPQSLAAPANEVVNVNSQPTEQAVASDDGEGCSHKPDSWIFSGEAISERNTAWLFYNPSSQVVFQVGKGASPNKALAAGRSWLQ